MTSEKKILFFSLNSPGHVNSAIGIADKMKADYGCKTIFLLMGPPMGSSIQDHGHELVIIDEVDVFEDYEFSDSDSSEPADEEAKKKAGKTKKTFPGASKWPQLILRYQNILRGTPVEVMKSLPAVIDREMGGPLVNNYERYSAALESIKPDMVIVDSLLIPPNIVKLTHIPWVKMFTANPLTIFESRLPDGLKQPPMSGLRLYTKEVRDKWRREDPAKLEALYEKWRSTMKVITETMKNAPEQLVHKLLKEHGCDPLPPGKMAHDSPHLNLYLYPAEIDYTLDDDILELPPRWLGCDSLPGKNIGQANSSKAEYWAKQLAEGMKGKDKMIYFSLGSIASGDARLMKRYIDIFKDDTQRLYVVSKGINGHKFDLNPANMIGDNYIPQTFFLEQADLAIIHGGNNSITECLYSGIPMIVLPMFADQIDNAMRIDELGLGKNFDVLECNKEKVLQAIDNILSDNDMIEKAREIGKKMRERNDLDKVSILLKKLLDDGHLDESMINEFRSLRSA